MSRELRVVVCLLALAAAAYGQSAPLVKVEVLGTERLSVEKVIGTSGLAVGQAVDKAVLDAVAGRMMATGLYERVGWKTQPGEQGVTVTLTVREAPEQQVEIVLPAGAKIQRVEIRGVTGARVERLAALLDGVMNGRAYRQDVVEEVAGPLVRTALAEWAHWNPVLTFKQEEVTRLVVEIDEGPVAAVGEVTMGGGEAKWLVGAGYVKGEPAESKKLNLAMGKVIEAARNDGYLAATARQEHNIADGRLDLRLVMETGPLYRFGELLIEGLPEQGEKRARALWKLKPGDAAGAAALENWIRLVFEKRIPVRDKVERQWRQRQGQAVADAVVAFR